MTFNPAIFGEGFHQFVQKEYQQFGLMTVYALFIGTATVMSGWLPDIPFVLPGLYSFFLMLIHKKEGVR